MPRELADTSGLQNAATAAYAGSTPQLSTSTAGVSETLSVLNSISRLIK